MKMSFKFAFSVLILIAFIFQANQSPVMAVTTDNSGFPQVDLGPGFNVSLINNGYKFYNSSEKSQYSALIANWANTFGNQTPVTGSITADSFLNVANPLQVMTIFGSTTNVDSSEVSAITQGLNQGKGLLYLAGSDNVSSSAQTFFNDLFGVSLVNFTSSQVYGSYLGENRSYVVSTQFSSPVTPITANISKLVLPDTIGMNINYTAIPDTNFTIKDIYPIVVDSQTKQPLGIAIELGYYGRIIILGSKEMFSNNLYSNSGLYANMYGLSNQLFAINIMKWLGRATGYFHMLSHTENVVPLEHINRGFVINTTVELTNEYNQTLSDVQVRFDLAVTNSLVDYNYMTYIGNNKFFGSISTRDARYGYMIDINARLYKRGYVDQKLLLGRVYVKLEFPGPTLPDLSISTMLIGGILIYSISAAYVWKEYKKLNL